MGIDSRPAGLRRLIQKTEDCLEGAALCEEPFPLSNLLGRQRTAPLGLKLLEVRCNRLEPLLDLCGPLVLFILIGGQLIGELTFTSVCRGGCLSGLNQTEK